MQFALIVLSTALLAAAPQRRPEMIVTPEAVTVPGCLVTLIEDVEVPAEEAGVLVDIMVREGDEVSEGAVLAQLDDKRAETIKKVSEYKLNVAEKEAGNDISVRYARAAAAVAEAEYLQALEANRRVPGTVPQAELRRMLLAHRQATLQIEQSEHDLGIAKVTVDVRQAELDAATEDVKRRQITARFERKSGNPGAVSETEPKKIMGMVVKRYRNVGEWVQPGEPVIRIVRMDRLRIEAFLDATRVSRAQVNGKRVTVTLAYGRKRTFQGNVVFASPITEAGPQFLVWAEVKNEMEGGHWLLLPGQNAEVTIHLK